MSERNYGLTPSDLPALEGWQEDALAEMPRCEYCRMRVNPDAPNTVVTISGRYYCSAECQSDDYMDPTR